MKKEIEHLIEELELEKKSHISELIEYDIAIDFLRNGISEYDLTEHELLNQCVCDPNLLLTKYNCCDENYY